MNMDSSSNNKYTTIVIGNYGNFNMADEILLKKIIEDVKNESGPVTLKFYIPTRNPDFVKVYHNELVDVIVPVPINDIFRCIRTLIVSDQVIIGGGGIWSGFTGPIAHLIPAVAVMGRILGKSSIYFSWSIRHPFVCRQIVSKFRILDSSVRDMESYLNLCRLCRRRTDN
jgi:polysaccharide pyruvyl transferase WcaK-like protein